ncbi:MAG: HAD family hydrolase [Pseudomonadota bacterium]
MTKSPFGLIIFDCDGVLIDSETIALQVLREALAQAGLSLDHDTAQRRFQGRSLASMVASVAADGVDFHAQRRADMAARLKARFVADLAPVEGMRGLIDDLIALGVPVCVASSSGTERLNHSLHVAGLLDRLAPHVFSADRVTNGKPAPDLFFYTAEAMDVAPNRCVVVEDSLPGIKAGLAAGMETIGFAAASHATGESYRQTLADTGVRVVTSVASLRALLLPKTPAPQG